MTENRVRQFFNFNITSLFLVSFWLFSCSTGPTYSIDKNYEFKKIPNGWLQTSKSFEEVDYSYKTSLNSKVYSMSLCNYYKENDIADIREQKLYSLQVQSILSEEEVQIDDRSVKIVHFTVGRKKNSGEVLLANFLKSKCYYEIVLFSPNPIKSITKDEYKLFLTNMDF